MNDFGYWKPLVYFLNQNDGAVSFVLFIGSALYAWWSGIIAGLRHRPKLQVRLIDGPSFASTFLTGGDHEGYQAHRTAFALYLEVSNVGTADTSIGPISIAFHWNIFPSSMNAIRRRFGWTWVENETIALDDFQHSIGSLTKIYPFLKQRNKNSNYKANTFLRSGEMENGVVYFEAPEAWGGAFPLIRHGKCSVKLSILDAFGQTHFFKFNLPVLSLEEAKKFNPRFGTTLSEFKGVSEQIVDCLPTAK